jgi:hypothetical protein
MGLLMGLLSQISTKAEIHRMETIQRFDDFFAAFFARLADGEGNGLMVTLIARSPDSQVAQAVLRHGEQLARLGVGVQAIFANIEPAASFAAFIEATAEAMGDSEKGVMWARSASLLEAHEQLVLGGVMSWTGDAMRRSGDVRFGLDMFEQDDAAPARNAASSFEGVWSVSSSVPRSFFRNSAPADGEPLAIRVEGQGEAALEGMSPNMAITRH